MEERGIDRKEARAMLRLSKAAKDAIKADEKFIRMVVRWMEKKPYFQSIIKDPDNPKEKRKFQRFLNIANTPRRFSHE